MKKVKLLALSAAITAMLASCAQQSLYDTMVDVNEGAAQARKAILLKNILRASRDEPIQFTGFTKVTDTRAVNFSTGLELSLGPEAAAAHEGALGFGGSHSNFVEAVDFSASAASTNLYTAVSPDFFLDLPRRGWSGSVAGALLIQSFSVYDRGFLRALSSKIERTCKSRRSPAPLLTPPVLSGLCPYLAEMRRKCECRPFQQLGSNINSGASPQSFYRFQAVLSGLMISGATLDVKPKKIAVIGQQKEQFQRVPELIFDGDPRLTQHYRQVLEDVRLQFRSPVDIIQFVGDLVAMQLHQDPPFFASVLVHDGRGWARAPLFVIQPGLASDDQAFAAVSYAGREFHVPRQNQSAASKRARSGQIMSFILELQSRSQAGSKIQPSQTVILQ